jgi:hypothetical protein
MLTGNVLAQGTLVAAASRAFAHELLVADTDLTLDAVTYTMGVDRLPGSNPFVLTLTLSAGTFGTIPPDPSANAGDSTATLRAGGIDANFVEYDVTIDPAGSDGLLIGDTFIFSAAQGSALVVNFPIPNAVGNSMSITADLKDVIGPIDTVGDKDDLVATIAATTVLISDTDNETVINAVSVIPPRTEFVSAGAGPDDNDTTTAAKVFITLSNQSAGVLSAAGVANFVLGATDVVTITITGDFTALDTDGLCFDLDGGDSCAGAVNEIFTIDPAGFATLAIAGDDIPAGIDGVETEIIFNNTDDGNAPPGIVMEPRTFGISVDVNAGAGATQDRSNITSGNNAWWVWTQNGTTFKAPFFTLFPTVEGKFRFQNTSAEDVTVIVEIFMDDPAVTFVQNLTSFIIPANSAVLLESVQTASGVGVVGPLISNLVGTQPIRGSAVFTALTSTNNVGARTLTPSALGVIISDPMDRIPAIAE